LWDIQARGRKNKAKKIRQGAEKRLGWAFLGRTPENERQLKKPKKKGAWGH